MILVDETFSIPKLPHLVSFFSSMVLNWGQSVLSPHPLHGGQLALFGIVFDHLNRGSLLISRRLGILLNILQSTGQLSMKKNYPAQNVSSAHTETLILVNHVNSSSRLRSFNIQHLRLSHIPMSPMTLQGLIFFFFV